MYYHTPDQVARSNHQKERELEDAKNSASAENELQMMALTLEAIDLQDKMDQMKEDMDHVKADLGKMRKQLDFDFDEIEKEMELFTQQMRNDSAEIAGLLEPTLVTDEEPNDESILEILTPEMAKPSEEPVVEVITPQVAIPSEPSKIPVTLAPTATPLSSIAASQALGPIWTPKALINPMPPPAPLMTQLHAKGVADNPQPPTSYGLRITRTTTTTITTRRTHLGMFQSTQARFSFTATMRH